MVSKRPIKNEKLNEEELFSERVEVIAKWPAKREIDLDEAIEYQKKLGPERDLVNSYLEAEKTGDILVVAHGGCALPEEMRELYRTLSEAGCDVLPLGCDTYTRAGMYEKASQALEESKQCGKSLINGWPIVAHGIEATRKIIESSNLPVIFRGGVGPDTRLNYEIALASGIRSSISNAVSYFTTGSKKDSFEQCLRNFQYIDRLIGYYESRGVSICRGVPGNNVGLLVPFSLHIAYEIAEMLVCVEQGIKHINPSLRFQGELIQDIAASRALMELSREYLDKFGYHDVKLFPKGEPWWGRWPLEEGKAYAIICLDAAKAALAGALSMRTKTAHEAHGVPTLEAHAASVQATKLTVSLLKGHTYPDTEELLEEREMIKKETRAIVDHILELGEGDIIIGLLKGVETGAWDSTFTPNVQLKGKIVACRDKKMAVRYLDPGNIPFSKEIIEWNKEKIQERVKIQGVEAAYQLMIEDIMVGLDFARPRLRFWGTPEEKRAKGSRQKRRRIILTGVIGSEDPHVVGTKMVSYALQEEGFQVVALGAKNDPEEIAKAAIESKADAMFLSSYAGMGEFACRDLRKKCEEVGIGNILIYLGGTIVTGKQDFKQVEMRFKELGINRIYPPTPTSIVDAIHDLNEDLKTGP